MTSLHIINEEVGGIILTAAGAYGDVPSAHTKLMLNHLADGVIRLYRNYDPSLSNGPVQMVSSFRGAKEVLQVQRGSGVITDWRQTGGTLLVGGDSRVVWVWDAHTESQVTVSAFEPCQNADAYGAMLRFRTSRPILTVQ